MSLLVVSAYVCRREPLTDGHRAVAQPFG